MLKLLLSSGFMLSMASTALGSQEPQIPATASMVIKIDEGNYEGYAIDKTGYIFDSETKLYARCEIRGKNMHYIEYNTDKTAQAAFTKKFLEYQEEYYRRICNNSWTKSEKALFL